MYELSQNEVHVYQRSIMFVLKKDSGFCVLQHKSVLTKVDH